jgi:hypothetical protein
MDVICTIGFHEVNGAAYANMHVFTTSGLEYLKMSFFSLRKDFSSTEHK